MRKGGTPSEALWETVKLAQAAESFGYTRYWVAEHHNSGSYTGTSPEVLIGQIAANTRAIRVGSGGVMLTHYSAFKVAEQFRILETFFPGRIDLGIGRAPGSDQLAAAALAHPRPQSDINQFPQQITDLLGFLAGTLNSDHPFAKLRAQPGPPPDSIPEVWLLGSTDYSARLAASLGLPFAFAEFFGNPEDRGVAAAELYRKEFKPSRFLAEPKVNVAVQVMCAPTEEEAQFIASGRNLGKGASVLGLSERQGMLSPEEASAYPLTEEARKYLQRITRGFIDGDPQQVRERILKVAERYSTTDIGIVTNCYYFEHRVRSYQLIAEAFGLTGSA
ncbi:MAG: LLM class flavin-dependent oxidoreductase [Chloroflexi bacterium]|nr:LLM class flavin-dependent oxidoreductase [Chloroflexota bacterium]